MNIIKIIIQISRDIYTIATDILFGSRCGGLFMGYSLELCDPESGSIISDYHFAMGSPGIFFKETGIDIFSLFGFDAIALYWGNVPDPIPVSINELMAIYETIKEIDIDDTMEYFPFVKETLLDILDKAVKYAEKNGYKYLLVKAI